MWNIRSGLSEAEFERWYKDTHIEDAKRIPGLIKYTVNRITGGRQSGAPYYRMAELCFANEESFQKAFGSAEWKHAFEDAQNYITGHIRLQFDSVDIPLPGRA
jgi:uncharacterized protein (TIGR02118 family)